MRIPSGGGFQFHIQFRKVWAIRPVMHSTMKQEQAGSLKSHILDKMLEGWSRKGRPMIHLVIRSRRHDGCIKLKPPPQITHVGYTGLRSVDPGKRAMHWISLTGMHKDTNSRFTRSNF
jgi:hypothetical protein